MSLVLFQFSENNSRTGGAITGPLAYRMRPQTLDQFVGHELVLGEGKPLRHWIVSDRLPSLILWGPPGCGKTTLAQIIARQTHSDFESLSAVLSGAKEIKEVILRAKELRRMGQRRMILFIDEIHRFNQSQQDLLLPSIEDGTLTLIGATTGNPAFELNPALLSRVRVIRLERLTSLDIQKTIRSALKDPDCGLGGFLSLSEESIRWLADTAEGDARRALTALEAVALFVGHQGVSADLGLDQVQLALESTCAPSGEDHYSIISAWIKSMRGNDPHAGLYYLARMLISGEDPLFIARRLVVFASEDIGNADPRALQIALSVKEAVEFVGMPEARISLAHGVTYLATAPKSKASYLGITAAMEEVERTGALPIPFHLKKGEEVNRSHLPDALAGKRFYCPQNKID